VAENAVPVFRYKNDLGIDRAQGFLCRFVVSDAARHDGAQLGAVLNPAYRQRRLGRHRPLQQGKRQPAAGARPAA
jgi:hypothetical protein